MSTYKSAIIIMPPESVWEQIQEIRRKYDKAFGRWMPHINLIYPFYDDTGNRFEMETRKICKQISWLRPFKVHFTKDSFATFTHNKYKTLWLKPLEQASCRESNVKPQGTKKKPRPAKNIGPPVVPRSSVGHSDTLNVRQPVETNDTQQTTPSIDNLRDAIWRPEDTFSTRGTSIPTGIDALRFAYWTIEDATGHTKDTVPPAWRAEVSAAQAPECCDFSDTDSTISTSSSSSSSHSSVLEEDEETPPTHTDSHNSVLELQAILQQLYADRTEQSTKSPLGFQPHLTLGQFGNNSTLTETLKANWNDVSFLVDRVYLISRSGNFAPFVIRKSVKLGAFDSE